MSIFPFGFEGCVVIENPAPEIFLRDQFRFRFEMPAGSAHLLVKRKTDRIDHPIGPHETRFDSAAVVFQAAIAVMRPVEWIESKLKPIGDSNLQFFANKKVVPMRAVLPRYRV